MLNFTSTVALAELDSSNELCPSMELVDFPGITEFKLISFLSLVCNYRCRPSFQHQG